LKLLQHFFPAGIFFLPISIKAQVITQKKAFADKMAKRIVIPYRIKDQGKGFNMYELKIFMTQDSGKTFTGPLQEVEGDVDGFLVEGEKVIAWNYLKEDSIFNGRNVRFQLEATYKPIQLGGPANLFWSFLLPGYGQTKVQAYPKFKWRWVLTSVFAFGAIGASFIFKSSSDANYSTYLESKTPQEANLFFERANTENIIASCLAIGAAGIIVGDMLTIMFRGFRNIKLRHKILDKNIRTDLQFITAMPYNQPVVGVRFKF